VACGPIGTTAPLKKFRFNARKLVEMNHLPDYKISLSSDAGTLTSRRKPAFGGNVRLPRLSPETFVTISVCFTVS
jgi:hypothetical protein